MPLNTSQVISALLLVGVVAVAKCVAEPIVSAWGSTAVQDTRAVAAARLSGWYASSSTREDSVEIRDIRGDLLRRIERSEIQEIASWMDLGTDSDGPNAMAFTDSGRALFILIEDNTPGPDGLGSDIVLRYDTTLDELSVFARLQIGDATGSGHALLHYQGRLWVSTAEGSVLEYRALKDDTTGFLQSYWGLPDGSAVHDLSVSRSLGLLFAVSDSGLYRLELEDLSQEAMLVGAFDQATGIAYSDHYGAAWQEGAYITTSSGIEFVPRFQVTGLLPFAPSTYLPSSSEMSDVVSTACGRLLVAGEQGTQVVRDNEDPHLSYEEWLRDEFEQVFMYASGLVSPDGEPSGWVIDGDVLRGGSRFHPPTPDAAAWVVMLLIAKDHLGSNQASTSLVREILRRYAGLAFDEIFPNRSADRIFHHWYDPWTGGPAPGWSDEYATLSTMLLVTAADRARRFYSSDSEIVLASDLIIQQVANWEDYIQPVTNRLYLRALASGGPDFGTASGAFNEGVLFVEQAAVYGEAESALDFWLDRASLPESSFVQGLPVTSNSPGGHLPAFVTLYPYIAQYAFRSDSTWQEHTRNLLASNGAWVDDHAPEFMTVFSAGTTRSDWGGYHADSLSDHPGNVTTFPSLMGFGSTGDTAPSVGAYHAYRKGARADFETGTSMLYRRSDVDPSYRPGDAGLPDVAIGALGLAELIRPGTIDAVLAVPYQPVCAADFSAPEGQLDFFDVSVFLSAYLSGHPSADMARPFGNHDFFDISAYLNAFSAGCP